MPRNFLAYFSSIISEFAFFLLLNYCSYYCCYHRSCHCCCCYCLFVAVTVVGCLLFACILHLLLMLLFSHFSSNVSEIRMMKLVVKLHSAVLMQVDMYHQSHTRLYRSTDIGSLKWIAYVEAMMQLVVLTDVRFVCKFNSNFPNIQAFIVLDFSNIYFE